MQIFHFRIAVVEKVFFFAYFAVVCLVVVIEILDRILAWNPESVPENGTMVQATVINENDGRSFAIIAWFVSIYQIG